MVCYSKRKACIKALENNFTSQAITDDDVSSGDTDKEGLSNFTVLYLQAVQPQQYLCPCRWLILALDNNDWLMDWPDKQAFKNTGQSTRLRLLLIGRFRTTIGAALQWKLGGS
ncbi:hypothetical protein PSHT_04607 [Puccinia striiformis]|uniref:Uncharacterized protein n=1 Tax=Puccinia striiformis TaxID=27350 RepID=A0A2S4WCJ0_9BASI|nr:hypothetical protein PSHT_04607 [Puccinia striiformis]